MLLVEYARRPFWLKPLFFIPVGAVTFYLLSRLEKMPITGLADLLTSARSKKGFYTGRWRLMPIPLDIYDAMLAPILDEVGERGCEQHSFGIRLH